MYCKNCGAEIAGSDRWCPVCGAAVGSRLVRAGQSGALLICPVCHRSNAPGSGFCGFCGQPIRSGQSPLAANRGRGPAVQASPGIRAAGKPGPAPAPVWNQTLQDPSAPAAAAWKPDPSNPPTVQRQDVPAVPGTVVVKKKRVQEKKHRLVPLKILLIAVCVLLVAAGIFLIPEGIRSARRGRRPAFPWRVPADPAETVLFPEEDDAEEDWPVLPEIPDTDGDRLYRPDGTEEGR